MREAVNEDGFEESLGVVNGVTSRGDAKEDSIYYQSENICVS